MKKIIIDKNNKYKKIFWFSCFVIMSIVSFLLYVVIKKTIKKGGNKIENAAQKNIDNLGNQAQEEIKILKDLIINSLKKIEYNVNNNINDFKTQMQKKVEEKIFNEITTSVKENINEVKENLNKQINENVHEVKENLNKQINENVHEVKEHINKQIDVTINEVKENCNPIKLLSGLFTPKEIKTINKENGKITTIYVS